MRHCRCLLTGATTVPLTAVPLWVEDPKNRSIVLEGVGWLATSLAEAQEKLLQTRLPRDAAADEAFQIANS